MAKSETKSKLKTKKKTLKSKKNKMVSKSPNSDVSMEQNVENLSSDKSELSTMEKETISNESKSNSSRTTSSSSTSKTTSSSTCSSSTSKSFSDLGLNSLLQQRLQSLGLNRPTPIQSNCIPAILSDLDVLGVSATGSGKTLAFALPILHKWALDPFSIHTLILTPTRELAFQIADQFNTLAKRHLNLRVALAVGGRDMVMQAKDLDQHPHVVVATPGRLADHLRGEATFSLGRVVYLVLDEADRLLDGGFEEDLETIFEALPPKRRTLLFTATINDAVQTVQSVLPENHFFFEAPAPTLTVDQLTQNYILTPVEARDGYLVHLVQLLREKHPKSSMLVFVKTRKACEVLTRMLNIFDFDAVALHSAMTMKLRLASLSRFKSGQNRILIATDVASRGLDIPSIDFVINHDVPSVTKNYVHRVGRTARAGKEGRAITLVTPHDVQLVQAIERVVGVQMTEFEGIDDEIVAEILTQVSVTRREQEIKLDGEEFDERSVRYRRKKWIMEGKDPDEEQRKIDRAKAAKAKKLKEKYKRQAMEHEKNKAKDEAKKKRKRVKKKD